MEKKLYDLTNPQKSIWLTEQYYKGTSINTICGTAIINNILDFDILKKAINLVIKNNSSFMLNFTLDNGEIKQFLTDYSYSDITIIDTNSIEEMQKMREKIISEPFKLNNSPLFKFYIFRFKDGSGAFMLNIHHLISDAWTLGFICNEIIKTYSDLKDNVYNYNEKKPSYIDYIISENNYIKSDKYKKDQAYWESVFKTIPEIASIPGNTASVTTTTSSTANRLQLTISKELVNSINNFCKSKKISTFNFFMAVFSIYIGRVSNLNDFVIGTPILNRTNFREKNTSGMFISTMPFRIFINQEETFSNFVAKISTDSLSMLRHQKYPYQNILKHLRSNNNSIPNLYNILLSYQITNAKNNNKDIDYSTEWTFNGNCADNLNIHLYDINDIGSLSICYDYQTSLYSEDNIYTIHNRILNMIKQILENEDILLNNIEIVTQQEKEELLHTLNKTTIDYDENIPIIKYFEKQVMEHPKDIALVFENATMTYEMLNERANSLAYVLRQKGVTNNSIVGIMENRSFEMIIAILAVLKSGGAYIPIDPDYPNNRISYMLEDSNASILLSEKSLKKRIHFNKEILYITLNNKEIYDSHKENIENISKPNDLSYIIYTSGSTGKPKGVMLTQKCLSNFYNAMLKDIRYLKEGNKYSIVSITTLSFDIFIFETLISLTRGLRLFITDYYQQKITSKLERLIKDNNINIIQTTPSVMRFHLDNLQDKESFSKLKYVILAGEQLPKQLVDNIKQVSPNCTIYNGYGPSETTIFSTVKDVTNLDKISIGKPIGNTQIYILDKNLSLLPKGVIGEIFIGGDGVGKGYLYKENLTAEKYLPNPYKKDSIIYRTGDLGLWQNDGNIECKGRIDNQVKLRGLRIELGEIEQKINSFKHDNLLKSAVILKHSDGRDSLNAFISYPDTLNLIDLKKYLLKNLPNYMMPSTYTIVEKLPLTPNGKIDKKELQNYEINVDSNSLDVSAPRNKTEELLVASISKKLNAENFGIDSNIFDFGADSLSIINILTDLFRYNFNLKVYDLYKYPTVRELYDNLLTEVVLRKNLDTEKYGQLNDKVADFSKETNACKINCKYNVLLTGATGFLGAHLLAELLSNTNNINKIYCTMRTKDNINSTDRLLNKFHFYFGNEYDDLFYKYVVIVDAQLPDNNFGLSKYDYNNLGNNIDIVIHSAANVKHYGNYSDFEKINVVGTRNIIDFCKTYNLPLHYISTMTVSGNYLLKQNKNNFVFTENSFYQKQKFDQNVYSKSKLLAESYIIDDIKNGLTATIYRIGDLTGRYSDGVFQENINQNSIYLRLKSILEIKTISESILNNDLEFTPVEYAAKAICKIIWSNNNKDRIFNIYNPNMISVKKLIKYMNEFNYNIKSMSQSDFVHYIKVLSEDTKNQNKISGIINDFTEENELIYNYTIKQNNDITCRYLKNLDFNWPILDRQYICKLLNYMKKVDFIK